MGAQLISVANAGDKSGEMAITWAMQGAGGATLSTPDNKTFPDFPYVVGSLGSQVPFFQYILNPQNVQSAVNFGVCRSIQVTINRPKMWWLSGASCWIPGRIFINVKQSGQLFAFNNRDLDVSLALPVQTIFETFDSVLPVWSKNYSPINVWFEQDNASGVVNVPTSLLILTMFNYDVKTPGTLS